MPQTVADWGKFRLSFVPIACAIKWVPSPWADLRHFWLIFYDTCFHEQKTFTTPKFRDLLNFSIGLIILCENFHKHSKIILYDGTIFSPARVFAKFCSNSAMLKVCTLLIMQKMNLRPTLLLICWMIRQQTHLFYKISVGFFKNFYVFLFQLLRIVKNCENKFFVR